MTDTSLPHDKMSLTRISEIGRECEQKLEEERGREQAQLEQAHATTLRHLRDRHLVELEKVYDLSDMATISCRIRASDTEYCWGGDPARPRRYLLVINVPGHKDVYRQFHLQDGDYVRSGQWCVDYAGWNPHHTLQDALVRARESWLRDETSDAQSECGIGRKTKERVMTDRSIPFDPNIACDNCGAMGAFDFMGDYLCEECSRGGGTVQKWEYLVLWFTKDDLSDTIQGIFNDWGTQGWELVAVCERPGYPNINQVFFKRANATTALS